MFFFSISPKNGPFLARFEKKSKFFRGLFWAIFVNDKSRENSSKNRHNSWRTFKLCIETHIDPNVSKKNFVKIGPYYDVIMRRAMEHFRFFEISLNIAKTGVVLAIISQFFLLIHKIYDLAEIFWPLKCVWRHNAQVSQCSIFFIFDHENQFFCYYGPCLSKKWPRICLYSVVLLSEAISTIYFWFWPVVLKISVIF